MGEFIFAAKVVAQATVYFIAAVLILMFLGNAIHAETLNNHYCYDKEFINEFNDRINDLS